MDSTASITIRSNDRVIILGQSQSGKTNLIKYLALKTPRWVWIDVKHRVRIPGAPVVRTLDGLRRAITASEPRVIYYPNNPDLKNKAGQQEVSDLCNYLMDLGNITFITDEVSAMCTSSTWPNGLANIVQRGAELGVGLVAGSQRPSRITQDLISEALHVICFRLINKYDRKKLEEVGLGEVADQLNTVPVYHWLYWTPNDPENIQRFDEKAVGKVL